MDIRSYLCREAAALTARSLESVRNAADWERERSGRLAVYLDRMGLSPYLKGPRTPLNVQVTGVLERQGYRVEKLYYESLPRLYVTANLYVPTGLKGPAPAVAYFCGHSGIQKIHYQSHPRRWAQLGFIALVVDTIQFGEIRSDHHGTWSQGRFHWFSRGYSPAGVECWNGIRALDVLAARPEVDADRMGITGISGGGGMSWWLGAADERARVVAPVCGTGTLDSHIDQRTLDGHCDCMYHINNDLWDLSDIGALIAPRPLLVCSADHDGIYKIDSVRACVAKVARIYKLLGAGDRIRLLETPGPHSYHETSRTEIFSLFLKELANKDVPAEQVGDLDASQDEPDPRILRVYVSGSPADERVSTIDDEFIPRVPAQAFESQAQLERRREDVRSRLRELTFNHFPDNPPPLEVDVHQRLAGGHEKSFKFRFTSEAGVRIPAEFHWHKDAPAPRGVIVCLRSPGEGRWESESFLGPLREHWAACYVQTRGVGELSWGPELSWHVRRATAALGRTVASLRVYDALRTLEAVRGLPDVDGRKVVLAGRGEMAVVALYAALLDGNVRALLLAEPPASQNEPGRPDGTGPTVEMLSCLRVTDLPEVAALQWPAELVFVRWRPESYELAEATYRNLGAPGAVRHAYTTEHWPRKPADL